MSTDFLFITPTGEFYLSVNQKSGMWEYATTDEETPLFKAVATVGNIDTILYDKEIEYLNMPIGGPTTLRIPYGLFRENVPVFCGMKVDLVKFGEELKPT